VTELFTQGKLLQAVAIVAGAFVLYRIALYATAQLRRLPKLESDAVLRAQREQRVETLRSVLNSVALVVVIAIAAVALLSIVGDVDVLPVLAGAGVLGVAVGFGAQSLVRDFFAGFFIFAENQFAIGDRVTIAGHTGTVERLTLRITQLRDADGSVHIVPNGKIDSVTVHAKEWARASVDVTVDYKEPLDRVFDVIARESAAFAEEHADAVAEPPELLGVETFGPRGPSIRVTARTKPGRELFVARGLRRRIKAAFDREGIHFPLGEDK
jgi:small-conductance mechanosensitive channel